MTPHWTNALPPHWKVRKLKYLAEVRLSNADKKSVEGEQPIRLCNYVDVYKNDFITSTMPFMEATATDVQIRELALRAGDVLITKDSEEWNDIAVPTFVPADLPGVICGYHLAHLRPDPEKMFGGYLFRAFAAQGIADQFKVAANGITRYGISKDDIASALFPVPPVPEQRAIAEFLDRKTAEIDAVVAKKARLIELLREERQAVIARAVAQGLKAEVPKKDSTIPGLNSIPADWTELALRHLLQRSPKNGISPPPAEDGEGVPSFSIAAVRDGKINLDGHVKWIKLDPQEAEGYRVRQGDILIMRGNANLDLVGTAGVVEVFPDGCTYPDILIRLTPNERVDRAFLVAVINGRYCRWQIERAAKTSNGTYKVSGEDVAELRIALPPVPEQIAIRDHIRRETGRIDGVVAKNEEQIAKLREYRQVLISTAVTGKIAVKRQPAVAPKQVTAPQPAVAIPTTEPAKKPANAFFRRSVFAAEIIDRLHDEPTFGHVKFQKVFFVAQHHLQVGDFEENYHRQAAGPYDNSMIRSVDSQLEKQKWFAARHTDARYVYEKLAKAGGHRQYFDRYFGQQAQALEEVLAIFRTLTTEQAEIVATLYAVWNDFLILGEPFDDARIIDDVLNNWHKSKQKIDRDRWQRALDWMREKGLVPHGFGKPTRQGGTSATAGDAGEADGPDDEQGD